MNSEKIVKSFEYDLNYDDWSDPSVPATDQIFDTFIFANSQKRKSPK